MMGSNTYGTIDLNLKSNRPIRKTSKNDAAKTKNICNAIPPKSKYSVAGYTSSKVSIKTVIKMIKYLINTAFIESPTSFPLYIHKQLFHSLLWRDKHYFVYPIQH